MNKKIARKSVRGGECPGKVEGERFKAEGFSGEQKDQSLLKAERLKRKDQSSLKTERRKQKGEGLHDNTEQRAASTQFLLISNSGVAPAGVLLNNASKFTRNLIKLAKQVPMALLAVILLTTMLFSGNVSAQVAEVKPLRLGEKVPAAIWQKKYSTISQNGALIDSVRLSDYANKLIILDFWASWCTACIKGFKHLDDIQRKFGSNVQILLVNANIKGDTEAKMMQKLNGYSLKSIIKDTTLRQLFPHEYIPHYVWLDEHGKLLALSTSEMVTEASINAIINPTN